MKKLLTLLLPLAALVILLAPSPAVSAPAEESMLFLPLAMKPGSIAEPVLKWKFGGCYNTWCETGWYSSPAVADVDHDGKNDVIASAYSLFALDGDTGALIWRALDFSQRTWPGVVTADIDQDGKTEIVIAQDGSTVSVFRLDGTLKWQYVVEGGLGELRGLLAADLDGDNSAMEIVVTRGYGSARNTWVLEANGTVRTGWPQLPLDRNNTAGNAWGTYNANVAAGDLDGDDRLEIVVPSDVFYINAYHANGTAVNVNTDVYPFTSWWGKVGAWESLVPEQRGWGHCDGTREESYRANFDIGPATIADLNGDGFMEIVAVGNMYDCTTEAYTSRYMALYILNPDRTRFKTGAYDWSQIPVDTGAPLSEDYNFIKTVVPNPVTADLDGDGVMEILFSSYDGRLHVYWLDKTVHGAWPYAVTSPDENFIRFSSEPLVVDLDADGKSEVIFTSWAQIGSNQWGKLHILTWDGYPLHEIDLPAPLKPTSTFNGGLPAPTLANIDSDADYELLINTIKSGVVAYELPGSAGAVIQWGTGRGSFTRTGTP